MEHSRTLPERCDQFCFREGSSLLASEADADADARRSRFSATRRQREGCLTQKSCSAVPGVSLARFDDRHIHGGGDVARSRW